MLTFMGNCQTACLTFYFQQLLEDVYWIPYGEEFKPHLGEWSNKVKNQILDDHLALDILLKSDVIIYQEVTKQKSLYSNTKTLQEIKKESCRLIKLPSIHLDYTNYDASLRELKNREAENNVDVKVSTIFERHGDKRLMLTIGHPNTFLLLEVVDDLCKVLNIDTLSELKRAVFLRDNNYMKLP